jgi:hypothetical protein
VFDYSNELKETCEELDIKYLAPASVFKVR